MTWVVAAIAALVIAVLLWRMFSSEQAAPKLEASEGKLGPKPGGKSKGQGRATKAKSKSTSKPTSKPPRGRSKSGSKGPSKAPAKGVLQSEADQPAASDEPALERPLSLAPPPNEFDNDWDDVDITMVAELPEEIKALQKGYRSVDPKQAVAEVAKEAYDDTAEIEVLEERMVDGLLVEELLSDDPTGPNALMLPVGDVRTDIGRRRRNNEDRPICLPEHLVFGVADGMGGHAAGEVASQIAAETIEKAFENGVFDGEPNTLWPRRGDELARSIEMANRAIFAEACEDDSLSGMGTTLTIIRFSPERQRAYIAHVGDSRCYRIRDGEMRQLTKDHTLGAELGAKGKMATHLSRSVGIAETVEVDLMVDAPKIGDHYLLCTDGLTKMLTEEQLLSMVLDGGLGDCVQRMIDEANEMGGKDNITVALVEIQDPVEDSTA